LLNLLNSNRLIAHLFSNFPANKLAALFDIAAIGYVAILNSTSVN